MLRPPPTEPPSELPSDYKRRLLDLPRRKKRALLVILDFFVLFAILWFGMCVRYGMLYKPEDWTALLLLIAAPVITISTMAYANLYRFVTRYLGAHGYTRILMAVGLSVLVWSLAVFMLGQQGIPRSVIFLYGLLGAAVIVLSRHTIGWLLRNAGISPPQFDSNKHRDAVLIYGAGQMGVELARALSRLPEYEVVGFCDRSPTLWGQYVTDIKVYRPDRLARVIERFAVREVLLAIPNSDRSERRHVLTELEQLAVQVKVMPGLEDIASGRVGVTELRPLDVDDLLGRDSVPPIKDLLSRYTQDKCVLVTGAGGSVGSELARQVLKQKPRRLILLDLAEPSLFNIDIELRNTLGQLGADDQPEIFAVLGSVLDAGLVSDTLRKFGVNTIYHAAAYKHVPLVEHNAAVGLENNTFGTEVVASAALANNVERMVLVSTDKAVRPANVMGASKRLAELVLQAKSTKDATTVFTMVRFGNVLDSSGSVVGRFRRQIRSGGPVTVTHPEVIRYFMSIPEAAELVIQAGAMAKGGDVFVLDMGEPVKIDELARLMIRLSGLDMKDEAHPDGDIEIVYTGLRPGEKLYEELLIDGSTNETEHPRIFKLTETAIDPVEMEREFSLLRAAMRMRDVATIQAVLSRTVEGYQPVKEARTAEAATSVNWVPPSRTLH